MVQLVYIASPFTSYANKLDAVRNQIDAFAVLRDAGYTPVAPLLCNYVDAIHPATYDRWLVWCLSILERCDALMRLPGESAGADLEEKFARERRMPVYYHLSDLLDA